MILSSPLLDLITNDVFLNRNLRNQAIYNPSLMYLYRGSYNRQY